MHDVKVRLSTLWVFMMLNYLYCDVISLLDPANLKDILAGHAAGGSVQITPEFLLASGVLMEIPIAMVLLSRMLSYRPNRWANVVAGAFMVVAQVSSLFIGTATGYYLFFSAIEIACLLFIVWTAWRWTEPVAANA